MVPNLLKVISIICLKSKCYYIKTAETLNINKLTFLFYIFAGLLAAKPKHVLSAETFKIHVVTDAALTNDVKTEGIISQIERNALCEWGTNVSVRTNWKQYDVDF